MLGEEVQWKSGPERAPLVWRVGERQPSFADGSVVTLLPKPPRPWWPYVTTLIAAAGLVFAVLFFMLDDPPVPAAALRPAPPAARPAPILAPVHVAATVAPKPSPLAVPAAKPKAQKRPEKVEAQPALPKLPAEASPVLVQYQRVGHELAALQAHRGTELTDDLWTTYRAIHIDDLSTALGRTVVTDMLTELQDRIERRQGVQLTKECLDNPLAADCR
jgi:hypothetical protein